MKNKTLKILLCFLLTIFMLLGIAGCSPNDVPDGTPQGEEPPQDVETPDSEQEIELTTDIVIIGAGGTGLTAAASAFENGADVIVLEKLAITGGSTALSGGGISATDTKFQRELLKSHGWSFGKSVRQ